MDNNLFSLHKFAAIAFPTHFIYPCSTEPVTIICMAMTVENGSRIQETGESVEMRTGWTWFIVACFVK